MSGTQRMTLTELLAHCLATPLAAELADVQPGGVCLDSRLIVAGDLYLAVAGASTHGVCYAADALQQGVAAVAIDPEDAAAFTGEPASHYQQLLADGAPIVEVPDLANQAAAIAARFHGFPDRELTLIAVTGTDGKTSVCQFVASALDALGTPCGYIGTLGWGRGDTLKSTALTTPDAVTLQRVLASLRDEGVQAVALEASSHALAGGRLDALSIDVAVLTNLGRDHLDFHGTLDAYRAAKARLFEFDSLAAVVLNGDDPFGRSLLESAASGSSRTTAFLYGLSGDVDTAALASTSSRLIRVRADAVQTTADGLSFSIEDDGQEVALRSSLIGHFNVSNLLACHCVLRALGHPVSRSAESLAALLPPAGRMERFAVKGQPVVVVDYAHTPQALSAALDATRAHCAGALWVVFGCGGDRDAGKRAPMGLAAEVADHVIVTDDNPRREASADIIQMILAGMAEPSRAQVVPDRREAIALAVRKAAANDVVLVAGKGHEDYQIVGDTRLSLSDRVCVNELLAEAC